MASRTAAATARTRWSRLALAAAVGTRTRQPGCFADVCHWAASAESRRAMAGARRACSTACALARPHAARLTAQTSADLLDQLFDIIRLLEGRNGEHVPIVLFQVLL